MNDERMPPYPRAMNDELAPPLFQKAMNDELAPPLFQKALNDELAPPPYLKDVPQLSDYHCRLAVLRRPTAAQISCVTLEIRRLCKLIRAARAKWETEPSDDVSCR